MKSLIFISVFCLFSRFCAGQQVTNFTLKDARTGSNVSLNQFSSGKVVVIIFTSNECPFDKEYRERIRMTIESFKGSAAFLLINSHPEAEESEDRMAEAIAQWNMEVPYLADKQQVVMTAFDARRSPEAFVLKPSGGKFQVVYKGAIDDNPQSAQAVTADYLKDAIEHLVSGKPLTTAQTRAAGCSIRRK
ncbi:MAG: redoxin domain-containing protein [Bacteroidetes bacterium]|nr:redoxin domain-containing protein [Bacteroidota bacterium]